ncbi:conserved Plasmodium protein, unknown function [Plasmodium relictum]|uniref:HTH OST-type domain-containing protein n=1 Tax=Plasmodium relictum TaxID=85471 RepID=A0A1J1HCY1_PLARL|nr:conserved Plasmodium protein, unknown function [Plasmodium relictum]CRH03840.1 conserved Plasmodium protein, unknown function [Plasmodium relictum]
MDSLTKDIKESNHKRNIFFNKSGGCIKENDVYHKRDISMKVKQQNVNYNNIYYIHNNIGLEKKKSYLHNRVNLNSKNFLNLNKNVNVLYKANIKDQRIKNKEKYSYYEPLRYPAFRMSDKIKSQKVENEETKNNFTENNSLIEKNDKGGSNDMVNKENINSDKKKLDIVNNSISLNEIINEKKYNVNNNNMTNTLSDLTEEENSTKKFNEIFYMERDKKNLKNNKIINSKNNDYVYVHRESVVNHKSEIEYKENKKKEEEINKEKKVIDNYKELKEREKINKRRYNHNKYKKYSEKENNSDSYVEGKEQLTDTMEITQKSVIFSSDEDNFFYDKENQEIRKFLSINQTKSFINPKEITNEVKFILHMTLLTLYKDQIKPTYRKIKQRLKCFNENYEIKYNFLNIYASLHNQYIVVKSKNNNIFVLLRETPKWFSGWVKTRSFRNSYPKKMWKKLITYFLDICKSKKNDSHLYFLIDFVKYLNKKKFIFSINSKSGDLWNSYDCAINADVEQDISNKFYLFNLENNDFSYFSQCNNSYRENLQNAFLNYYNFFLEEKESSIRLSQANILENYKNDNEDASIGEELNYVKKCTTDDNNNNNEKKTENDKNNYNLRSNLLNEKKKVDTEIPWEFDNDIYEVANFLKKKNFYFLKDYSLGKIAHIIQLSLYSGLMHEEGQLIKPSCSAKNIVSSIFYFKNNENNLDFNSTHLSNFESDKNTNYFSNDLYSENIKNDNLKNFSSLNHFIFDVNNYGMREWLKKKNYHSCYREEKKYLKNDEDFLKIYESYLKNDEYFFRNDELFFENSEDPFKNNEEKYYIPIKNIEDAKIKIERLLKNSHKKRIFLCLFREKFFRKYKETINPLYFGYNSLIEFLFFSCKDVCKIYILNNNLMLFHPSCDLEYLKKKSDDENIVEEFSYSDYYYNKPEKENSKFKDVSLEICSIMKDLAKKKNTFFITFCFWKNMNKNNKNILENITFLNEEEYIQKINRNKDEENYFLINNQEPKENIPYYTYFINNDNLFNISSLFKSKQHNYDYFNNCL